MAKDSNLTIRVQGTLKDRVVARAEREKRAFNAEAEFLIEKGLEAIENDELLLARVKAGLTDISPEVVRP